MLHLRRRCPLSTALPPPLALAAKLAPAPAKPENWQKNQPIACATGCQSLSWQKSPSHALSRLNQLNPESAWRQHPLEAEAKPAEPERPKAFKPETALPDGSSAGYRGATGLVHQHGQCRKMVAKLKEAGVKLTPKPVCIWGRSRPAPKPTSLDQAQDAGLYPLLVPLSK